MGTGEPCDLGGVRPVKNKVISPGDVRTRRDAARLAGELVWILRVRQSPPEDFQIVLSFARRVGLWTRTAEEIMSEGDEPSKRALWDAPFPMPPDEVAQLRGIIKSHVSGNWIQHNPRARCVAVRTVYAVTDAMRAT